MTRILVGSLIAAVVMFMFGFAFWAASGLSDRALSGAVDEQQARQMLSEQFPSDGTYKVPYSPDYEDTVWQERMGEGPIATVIIKHGGKDMESPIMMVYGFVHYLACALLIAVLLSMAVGSGSGGMTSFGKRLMFVTLTGVAMAAFHHGGNVVWWEYPSDFPLLTAAYDIGAWFLAGIVLAAMIKPKQGY